MMKGFFSLGTLALGLFSVAFVHGHTTEKLTVFGGSGPRLLQVEGEIGQEYVIQGTSDVSHGGSWQELAKLLLTKEVVDWTDFAAPDLSHRFYRLGRMTPSERLEVSNFRLLDHEGKSRALFYHWNQEAIVLVFLGSQCAAADEALAAIRAARDLFGPQGVLFWLIHSDPAMTRPALANLASAHASGIPILHDSQQLVAREFEVKTTPEIVCIRTDQWKIAYRGLVDNRTTTTAATVNYLHGALQKILAGEEFSPARTTASGCALPLPPEPEVAYARDVAPLLQKHCVSCHSAGNIAPFELKHHQAVKDYASLIAEKISTGAMPPWHADPAYGRFVNDVSLQPEEIRTLLHWLKDGAPRGDGPDPLAEAYASEPPPADYPQRWPVELGEPDYFVTLPKYTVPATGDVDYKYVSVRLSLPSNSWVRAAVILPGNPKVVHHALAFQGTLLDVLLFGGGLGGYFAAYVPGQAAVSYPVGTGKLLPANSTVTLQMHYTTTGHTETDETKLGVYLMKSPPSVELKTTGAYSVSFVIPPGAAEYAVETAPITLSSTREVLVYEMSPHMHYRGLRMQFEALYPNGSTEVLLSVPNYDFQWQTLYRLAEPKRLPAGTRLRCRGAFDNSLQNRFNPDPDSTVLFGEQTHEEMFIGYVNYSLVP